MQCLSLYGDFNVTCEKCAVVLQCISFHLHIVAWDVVAAAVTCDHHVSARIWES